MTITDEQLAEDKEFVDSDAFFILHGRVRLRAYISEVERLRAEIRKMSPSYMPDSVITPRTKLKEQIERLQAENAELKKAILWIEPWAYIAIDQMDSSKLAAGRLADLKKVKALVDIP